MKTISFKPQIIEPQTWQLIDSMLTWTLPFSSTIPMLASFTGHPELGLLPPALLSALKLIASANKPDWFIKPQKNSPFVFLGYDEYGLPLLVDFKTLVRHILILGTTGSGKTTLIRKLLRSVGLLGGGSTFIDGKSDVLDTYMDVVSILNEIDRIDDLLVLNFLNPLQSNTFNPFVEGDADFCSELLNNFLSPAKSAGSGDSAEYFRKRGELIMKCLINILVWNRDNNDKKINILNVFFKKESRIFDIWDINRILSINYVLQLGRLIKDNHIDAVDKETQRPIGEELLVYLNHLGKWEELLDNKKKKSRDVEHVVSQHNFAVQQWSGVLSLLGGTYGPIFKTDRPEIVMTDVITNGRFLYVLLPSLSKSSSTLSQLGQMMVSAIKMASDRLLGKDVVGNRNEIEKRVLALRPFVPHVAIFDEYGSYPVKGLDTILAQLRSLRIGVIVSLQELARWLDFSVGEARAGIGNTNLKILMKIEDTETAKIMQDRAGEELMLMAAGAKANDLSIRTDGSFRLDERSALRTVDLTGLEIGEAFLIKGKQVRWGKIKKATVKKPPEKLFILKGKKVDKKPEKKESVFVREISRMLKQKNRFNIDKDLLTEIAQDWHNMGISSYLQDFIEGHIERAAKTAIDERAHKLYKHILTTTDMDSLMSIDKELLDLIQSIYQDNVT